MTWPDSEGGDIDAQGRDPKGREGGSAQKTEKSGYIHHCERPHTVLVKPAAFKR